MTIEPVYQHLLADALAREPLTEDDALALMILIHTHRLKLREPTLGDRPGVTEVAAGTQRGAATIVGDLWPARDDRERTLYAYWYWQFNTRTPYEILDDVPPQWMDRINHFRAILRSHPAVEDLVAED
jgi:hypothetical protein